MTLEKNGHKPDKAEIIVLVGHFQLIHVHIKKNL